MGEIYFIAHLLTEPSLAHFLGPPPPHWLASWNTFAFITSFFCDVSQTSRIRGKRFFLEILIFSFQNLCIPSHKKDWHFMGGVPKSNEQASQVSQNRDSKLALAQVVNANFSYVWKECIFCLCWISFSDQKQNCERFIQSMQDYDR